MRHMILILLFVSSAVQASDEKLQLTEARTLFNLAANNEEACSKLLAISSNNTDLTLTAYHACATMIMAKHTINPFNKLSYFKSGKSILEKCIESENKNVEMRFLRFTIQTNVPGFLNYDDSISLDKSFLIKSIEDISDNNLRKMITDYLITSSHLSRDEKLQLAKWKNI